MKSYSFNITTLNTQGNMTNNHRYTATQHEDGIGVYDITGARILRIDEMTLSSGLIARIKQTLQELICPKQ